MIDWIDWNEVRNKLTCQLNYRNHFNELKDVEDMVNEGLFQEGDIITAGDNTYVYTGDNFQPFGQTKQSMTFIGTMSEWTNLSDEEKSHYDVVNIINALEHSEENEFIERKCRSCGAPLMVSKYSYVVKCEYCGTTYSK